MPFMGVLQAPSQIELMLLKVVQMFWIYARVAEQSPALGAQGAYNCRFRLLAWYFQSILLEGSLP